MSDKLWELSVEVVGCRQPGTCLAPTSKSCLHELVFIRDTHFVGILINKLSLVAQKILNVAYVVAEPKYVGVLEPALAMQAMKNARV